MLLGAWQNYFNEEKNPAKYTCYPFLLQISYAIAIAEPLSIYIDTYGTGKKTNKELLEIIKKNFDLRPGAIIK